MDQEKSLYYTDLPADYSRPVPVAKALGDSLIDVAVRLLKLQQPEMPGFDVRNDEERKRIEAENREWWPAHCEALRRGRADLLGGEYRKNPELVYFCQDGPFYGLQTGAEIGGGWFKLMTNPGVTLAWPVVMFHGEVVFFEWYVSRNTTGEIASAGTVTCFRRGHAGGVHMMTEHLNFYRDVSAAFLKS